MSGQSRIHLIGPGPQTPTPEPNVRNNEEGSEMLTDILQPTHLLIVLVVALVVLGPKRLPDAGRSLGQGIREFRSSIAGTREEPAAERPELPESE
jgi:sec-independent protein translocase protein TatA